MKIHARIVEVFVCHDVDGHIFVSIQDLYERVSLRSEKHVFMR